MTEDQIALARRLAAAPWWEWRAGMRTACGVRVADGGADYLIGYGPGGLVDTCTTSTYMPDLTDDATAGVLLGMLSRLTTTSTRTRPDPYVYWVDDRPHVTAMLPTLGEAAAQALLAVRGDR